MKCIKCGYTAPAQFNRCPSCGAVQVFQQPVTSTVSPYKSKPAKRSGGETAAIVIAIIVAVISVIAALVIFVLYMSFTVSKVISSDDFDIDSFRDFTSDDNDEDMEEFFKDFNFGDEQYNFKTPAGRNTPIKFKDKLYSFSEGEVETEYEVTMTETYRGEAALKLLEGAALPVYNDEMYDIYLVKFNVSITSQEKDAIVTFPMTNHAAYPSDSKSFFTDEYSFLSELDYANQYALISNGDTVETWAAFIVDKSEQSPCILWDRSENKAFRNQDEAISSPDSVASGAAIELKKDASSEDLSDEVASNDDSSSD